jgi:hypothetical protein
MERNIYNRAIKLQKKMIGRPIKELLSRKIGKFGRMAAESRQKRRKKRIASGEL